MSTDHIDAAALHNWAKRSVAELSLRRTELNELNVFPVPDADTGSNMAHTMEAALAEADKGGDVAEALAIGSVRGARGNSGMVLSQVLRAVADSSADSLIDAHTFANALNLAVELVDRAIAEPVEGTVVSVLRAAALAAQEAVTAAEVTLASVLNATCDAARQALANTPSQLPVLREAGVVDAGGAGLLILLECLLAEVEETAPREAVAIPEAVFELEVVFFYEGDIGKLEAALNPFGDSLVIARATETAANVHIHTTEAGRVIETAFGLGAISNLRLEVLPSKAPAPETTQPGVYVAVREKEMAKLFSSIGATIYTPGTELEPADIFIGSPRNIATNGAQVVEASSHVAAMAALSVYAPGPEAAAAMEEAASAMRVDTPSDESIGAIIACCNDLLASGGEQVTILTSLTIDTEQLSRQLGVEVIAVTVPGMRTEIGVE
ncbi:DAK2 domain-containing protein [Corynebacterium sp. L4756]|uniref:DAK2 domain-containing protein n=1 Tax=unclassified Corynebacterium TaxID=2624378 RepID=UPI00374D8046